MLRLRLWDSNMLFHSIKCKNYLVVIVIYNIYDYMLYGHKVYIFFPLLSFMTFVVILLPGQFFSDLHLNRKTTKISFLLTVVKIILFKIFVFFFLIPKAPTEEGHSSPTWVSFQSKFSFLVSIYLTFAKTLLAFPSPLRITDGFIFQPPSIY